MIQQHIYFQILDILHPKYFRCCLTGSTVLLQYAVHKASIISIFESKYVVESSKEYPISINGKVRANINMDLGLEQSDVEKLVLQNEIVQKWLEGKPPKKIIYVKNKMVNVVI